MPALVRTPTGQAISEHIQTLIFEGSLEPGSRIDREQLAKDVGTSQIPVREALLRLEAEGAVVIEPHRGAFVAPVTEETVAEHWEVMGLIWGLIASKVAERQDAELVEELRRLVVAMDAEDEPGAFNEVALQAWRLVNHGGSTAKLRNLLRQFGRQVPGNFYARIPGAMDCARSGYRRLLDAIDAGDPDAAELAARSYMQQQGRLVAEVLRGNGVLAPA
jgi:DNA-binding GntR family transcriptional regulator